MEHDSIVDQVNTLDFITDRDMADAATKAVLGIITSNMKEDEAREFTAKLPAPLTLERLRGHQERVEHINVYEFIIEIGNQFKLNNEQSRLLINKVLEATEKVTGVSTRRLTIESGFTGGRLGET